MEPIIYLSEAQHERDNKGCCVCNSENGHSKALMDRVESAVRRQGWTYKRVPGGQFGDLAKRCAESDAMGANIHFVIHTNAGGGSNERMHVNFDNAKSKAAGQAFVDARKAFWAKFDGVAAPALKDGSSLYEVRNTKAICLYDECLFHDNDANMRVFHANMEANAESIVQALAAVFGAAYIAPSAAPSGGIQAGDKVTVSGTATVVSVAGGTVTLTASAAACAAVGGSTPAPAPEPSPAPSGGIKAGDKVQYSGRLYADSYGNGAGKTVSGTYTVSQVIAGRRHGVLLTVGTNVNDGLGWVPENECGKV